MSEVPAVPGRPEGGVSPSTRSVRVGSARVVRPERRQLEMVPRSLEDLIAEDHPARAIWTLLERLELDAFYATIRAVTDGPGRPASDPRVLLGLWVLATVEGIGSARWLARLTEEHDAYRWLRGRVPVNYHLLSDFRVRHQQAFDELLTTLVATLQHQQVVTLERVAQDGLRVRASAGASSFRRRPSLEACLEQAREQVERLATEREHPDPGASARERAARERAARERLERVEAALRELPAVEAIKARQRQKLSKPRREQVTEPRVSTTDPEARVMKLPDGGFRPAYNVQLVTDQASRAIVGVAVSQQGSDGGLAAPMLEQVVERCGQVPDAYLIDGGLATRDDLTTLTQRGPVVYAPVEPPRTTTSGRAATDPRPDDSPEVRAWRERMGTEQAKTIYRRRAALAEWTNAQWRHRHGLQHLPVRGLSKVTSVVLLLAVTHNLLRWLALAS